MFGDPIGIYIADSLKQLCISNYPAVWHLNEFNGKIKYYLLSPARFILFITSQAVLVQEKLVDDRKRGLNFRLVNQLREYFREAPRKERAQSPPLRMVKERFNYTKISPSMISLFVQSCPKVP